MKAEGYRPDVDGLRAVAILGVVFYHGGLGCPGGYVGVDIFFVISGFLITTLILKQHREGQFSLIGFWERRFRRIYPAAAVMVLTTLTAGWFLLLPAHFEKLGRSTVAQAFLGSNIYFWRTTNYFGGANAEKPLLHTWSLAVEEQFYLFFPLILCLLFKYRRWHRPAMLMGALLIIGLVSLLISVWGVWKEPYATFFLLPTRAWELLCGALVATTPTNALPPHRLMREGVSAVGLGCIVMPLFLYNDTMAFPGLAALPPCLGTALVIWANSPMGGVSPASMQTVASRLLSIRWIVFIGLISYSLYLWHWPVIVFSNYWKTAPSSLSIRWVLVGLSLVLALVSWRYVETPFRNRHICGTRKSIFAVVGGTTCLMILLGLSVMAGAGFPGRVPAPALRVVKAVEDNSGVWKRYAFANCNVKDITVVQNDTLRRLGSHDVRAPLRFLVLGDSHAGCAIPIFDKLGAEYGIAGAAITYQGTPPLFGWHHHFPFSSGTPDELWEAALDYGKRNRVTDVFLIGYWSNYQRASGSNELKQILENTIIRFNAQGFHTWVVLDNPTYDVDVVKGMVRKTIFRRLAPEADHCNEAEHRG